MTRTQRLLAVLCGMALLAALLAAGEGTVNINAGAIKDVHIATGAGIQSTKLALRALASHPQNLLDMRVWDAVDVRLPGSGNLESGTITAQYRWEPNGADDTFFVAVRNVRVVGITARVEVVGTDAGAVTAVVKKVASGTDIASGTALHTGSINLKGTVDTNQVLSLSATSTDLDIAPGTSIGIDFTGTLTAARGTVTVLLAPSPSADDLQIVTGAAYGTNPPRVETVDVKAAGAVTKRGRMVVSVPSGYVAAGGLQVRCVAGMRTTLADTSATILVEAYLMNDDGTVSANLVSTAAQSINSLTFASKDFVLDPTLVSAGSRLDVRVTMSITDGASGTSVFGVLQSLILRADAQP